MAIKVQLEVHLRYKLTPFEGINICAELFVNIIPLQVLSQSYTQGIITSY